MIYLSVGILLLIFSSAELSGASNKFLLSAYIAECILLTTMTGLRTWGGDDLNVYREFYDNIDAAQVSYGLAYEFINKFSQNLELPFESFVMILAVLVVPTQMYLFFKASPLPHTTVFAFYTMGFIWLDHVLIRQSIAVTLLLLSVLLFFNKKTKYFVLSVVASALFHLSSLVVIVMYLGAKYLNIIAAIVVLIIAYMSVDIAKDIYLSQNILVGANIEYYVNSDEISGVSNTVEILAALISLLLIRSKIDNEEKEFYRNSLVVGLLFLVVSYKISAVIRFLEYVRPVYCILFARLIWVQEKRKRILWGAPLYAYGLSKLYYFCINFDNGAPMNAYLQ